MSIDIFSETLITLEQAAEIWPRTVVPETIRNWIEKGACVQGRRVSLDGCAYGSSLGTSKEALQRFSDELVKARREFCQPGKQVSHFDKQALEELKAAGY